MLFRTNCSDERGSGCISICPLRCKTTSLLILLIFFSHSLFPFSFPILFSPYHSVLIFSSSSYTYLTPPPHPQPFDFPLHSSLWISNSTQLSFLNQSSSSHGIGPLRRRPAIIIPSTFRDSTPSSYLPFPDCQCESNFSSTSCDAQAQARNFE